MPRVSAAWRATGAGSATLPMASLYSSNNGVIWVVEIHVTNTTTLAFECSVKRVTTTGTQGTAQSIVYEDDNAGTARGDPRDTHTVAPTLVAGESRRTTIGASAGSGIIWTFGSRGMLIPSAAGQGVAVMPITGTGQISDVTFVWDY